MTAILQATIAEFGNDSPKRLPINGVVRSERIGGRGEASFEFDTATLRTNALLDCEGYWISHEHGDLGTWAGVIQQIRHDFGSGTTEVAAQTFEALLDARRTAKEYNVADGDAGAVAQKVIADAAKGGSMFIAGFRVQPTGLVDISLRSEQVVDAVDELARLADAEWRVTASRYFEFAKQIGKDLSASVVLVEGKNIDATGEVIRDVRPRINDLAVMSAIAEYSRRTAVVVRDDASIEEIGQRQGTIVKDYMVKESVLRPAGKAELARLQRLGRAATFDVLNVGRVWSGFTIGDTVRLVVPSCGVDASYRVLARSWDSDSGRLTVTGEWTSARRAAATDGAVESAPGLTGSALYHPDLTEAETYNVLDEAVALGSEAVIVSAVRYKTTSCAVDAYGWWGDMLTPHLGTILASCESRSLDCYVGLVESTNVCAAFYDEPNLTHDVNQYTSVVTTILATYGFSSALAGWYIPNEQALGYETRPDHLAAAKAYFLAVRNAIRAIDPNRPIIVAPYLGNPEGIAVQSAADFGQKVKDFFDNTGGDLIIWLQDSVGADSINAGWDRSGTRPITVGAYLAAALDAGVPAANLWGNPELFTYPTGGFTGPNYTAASLGRVVLQLEQHRAADKRFGWLNTTHMTQFNDQRRAGADRLYDGYRAWAGISGEWVIPAAVTYSVAPTDAYPDAATALLDRRPGDPRNPAHPDWTRFAAGGTAITVDMGATKTVRWAALSCLNDNADGARFPTTVAVATSPDGSAWTTQATVTPSWAGTDGEGVIGNTTALAVACRYVRFTVTNASYETLIDTVEIIAS
jgi:hypothetical protein